MAPPSGSVPWSGRGRAVRLGRRPAGTVQLVRAQGTVSPIEDPAEVAAGVLPLLGLGRFPGSAHIRIVRPRRAFRRGLGLGRRQVAGRRDHQRRALAIIDHGGIRVAQAEPADDAPPHALFEVPDRIAFVAVVLRLRGCRGTNGQRTHTGNADLSNPASLHHVGPLGAALGVAGTLAFRRDRFVRISPRAHIDLRIRWAPPAPSPKIILSDQGCFAARWPATESYKSPATPATMAASARLKTYHLKLKLAVVRCRSTKSATAP
jgi:hypothetical protein